jgi:hypothetical protein
MIAVARREHPDPTCVSRCVPTVAEDDVAGGVVAVANVVGMSMGRVLVQLPSAYIGHRAMRCSTSEERHAGRQTCP